LPGNFLEVAGYLGRFLGDILEVVDTPLAPADGADAEVAVD
jgi:hypothetical protein